MTKWLIEKILHPRWIVSIDDGEETGELGLRIFGINFWYYKWPEPMMSPERGYRIANKREFDEVVYSRDYISKQGGPR